MSAVSENTVYLNQSWLDGNLNKKSQGSLLDRVVTYMRRGSGANRTLKIIQKISRIITENGVSSDSLKRLDTGIGLTGSALGLTRIPASMVGAYKSISALRTSGDGISFTRKIVESVRDTMDFISGLSCAVAFVANHSTAGVVGQVTGLASDVADLQVTASDYEKAVELEGRSTGGIRTVLNHSKKYYLLRLVQSVVGIATGILGVVMLATGAPIVPTLAWISISLSMLVFSIALSFFKNKGPHKIVKFDKNVELG